MKFAGWILADSGNGAKQNHSSTAEEGPVYGTGGPLRDHWEKRHNYRDAPK